MRVSRLAPAAGKKGLRGTRKRPPEEANAPSARRADLPNWRDFEARFEPLYRRLLASAGEVEKLA
jgi:hypothetical protein